MNCLIATAKVAFDKRDIVLAPKMGCNIARHSFCIGNIIGAPEAMFAFWGDCLIHFANSLSIAARAVGETTSRASVATDSRRTSILVSASSCWIK